MSDENLSAWVVEALSQLVAEERRLDAEEAQHMAEVDQMLEEFEKERKDWDELGERVDRLYSRVDASITGQCVRMGVLSDIIQAQPDLKLYGGEDGDPMFETFQYMALLNYIKQTKGNVDVTLLPERFRPLVEIDTGDDGLTTEPVASMDSVSSGETPCEEKLVAGNIVRYGSKRVKGRSYLEAAARKNKDGNS